MIYFTRYFSRISAAFELLWTQLKQELVDKKQKFYFHVYFCLILSSSMDQHCCIIELTLEVENI